MAAVQDYIRTDVPHDCLVYCSPDIRAELSVLPTTAKPDNFALILPRPSSSSPVCSQPLLAVVYNLNNNTYRQFALKDSAFCGAHIMLANGKVAVVGGDNAYANLDENFGDGRFAVRIFTPGSAAQNDITVVANMDGTGGNYPCNNPSPCDDNAGGRWYPSLTTLPDAQVLITSGVVVGGVCKPAVKLPPAARAVPD